MVSPSVSSDPMCRRTAQRPPGIVRSTTPKGLSPMGRSVAAHRSRRNSSGGVSGLPWNRLKVALTRGCRWFSRRQLDERANRVLQQRRVAPVLQHPDARGFEVDDLDVLGTVVRFHVQAPHLAHGLIGGTPGIPSRLFSELGRCLSDRLLERARERLVALVSARQRDVDDPIAVPERQLVRGALQSHELHVPVDAHPEQLGKLPVEVKLGKRRHRAQSLHGQVPVQVGIHVLQHPAESAAVGLGGGFGHDGPQPTDRNPEAPDRSC